MRYLANPSSGAVVDAMKAGRLGFIKTPLQGNALPEGVEWCADNGCFSAKWDAEVWWRWLQRHAHAADRCLFAVAPDVVGDAWRTHLLGLEWLPRIRALGYPVAYVAQNGIDQHPMMPWADFDVLFIGGCLDCPTHGGVREPLKSGGTGSAARYHCPACGAQLTEWKLGPVARALVAEAKAHGKRVHMGRVNSRKRYNLARQMGCDSVDGTFLTYGVDRNLPELLSWLPTDSMHNPSPEKEDTMTERTTKTAQDRALEAFGVLERKAAKAEKNYAAARDLLKSAEAAHDEAQRRLAYAGQNPDLPESIRQQFVPEPDPVDSEGVRLHDQDDTGLGQPDGQGDGPA
jgi:hypothetical protein